MFADKMKAVFKNLFLVLKNPNAFLLLFLILIVFFVPVLSFMYHKVTYELLFSCIFLLSALALKHKRKKTLISFSLFLIIFIWIAYNINLPLLSLVARATQGLSFVYIIISLIRQTAAAKDVNVSVIADSISGYLLVGIIYTIIAYQISQSIPDSYHFPEGTDFEEQARMSKVFYYTFVTYSSTGYGDITPVLPAARSFATLISVTGQMYVAIIIALLVGKFSSRQMDD